MFDQVEEDRRSDLISTNLSYRDAFDVWHYLIYLNSLYGIVA